MNRTVFKNSLLGEYTYAKLDNGLSVYVMEKSGFSSSYAVFGTRYGSIDTRFGREGEKEIEVPEGIAHFLEHKLFENEEGDTFARFAKTGAYANAFTTFDRTCYLFSCTKNFEENLDILLDFVQSPYFTAETVEKEQGIIGQEIKMYEDSAGWRVFFNMLSEMYENHSVKIDIAGTVESIAKIDDKLLYECYNTFYNPENMYICIAGNVSTDEVISRIERGTKKNKGFKITRSDFTETDSVKNRYIEQSLEVAKPIFCLGFKENLGNRYPTVKERIVAGIALEVLCGDCSALYRRLIDSSLISDEFSSEYFEGRGYSAFVFEGETDEPRGVAEEISREIKYILENGIDEKLLEAAKKSAFGDAVKRFDSVEGIVMDMIDCAVSGGELFDTVKQLREITAEDITERLKVLKDECSVLSVVNPKRRDL
ncbi:MAG: insulinase family protein [Clostridia bacterium]|nr:insulinase family protein [Clostridia bacterium]